MSLGLGAKQIDAGLGEVFGAPSGKSLQMIIIAVTVAGYMLSASTPIEKGVNYLSQASIVLAVVLLAYFFVVGPTLLQFNALTQGIGDYFSQLVPMSLSTSAFDQSTWLGEWTIFFWATWIAWAPYVGAFIARISRGRTIREFLLGVLLAPSLFSVLWFAIFGASAIDLDARTDGAISSAAEKDPAAGPLHVPRCSSRSTTAPRSWRCSSSGSSSWPAPTPGPSCSAACRRAILDPSRLIKLTWGVIMGLLAAVLLLAGGLPALQNGAILAATPFAVIMVFMCWSLYRALSHDYAQDQPDRVPDQASR
ncbi:MAG: BCCT family transporter [Nocardioidaceae bacterium]